MNKLYILILVVVFGCSPQTNHLADVDSRRYEVDYIYKEDKTINEIIKPYKEELDAKMNRSIAYTSTSMGKSRPNSSLGNWFTDLLLDIAIKRWGDTVNCAFQNYGGLRLSGVGAGNISVGTIYELMPFDNTLVLMEMDGVTLDRLANHIASSGGAPISRGISFEMTGDRAINIMVNGAPLDYERVYQIAMPDYTANGGDGCDFLIDKPRKDSGIYIRDLIIEYYDTTDGLDSVYVDKTVRIKTSN